MVALMKISKLLFTFFEIEDQSFPLPPLALSAREIIFFSLLSKGRHHKLATLRERDSLNENVMVFQGIQN